MNKFTQEMKRMQRKVRLTFPCQLWICSWYRAIWDHFRIMCKHLSIFVSIAFFRDLFICFLILSNNFLTSVICTASHLYIISIFLLLFLVWFPFLWWNTPKKQLRRKGQFISAHDFRLQSIIVGKSRQELQSALSLPQSRAESHESTYVCLLACLHLAGFLSPINFIKTVPHRCTHNPTQSNDILEDEVISHEPHGRG